MKKTKIIAAILIIICTCATFLSAVSAHEVLSGMRWCHMSENSLGKPRCDILINWDYVDHTNWAGYMPSAINNWNRYSDNKVLITHDTYQKSTITLYDYGNNDSAVWPYDDCFAFTTIEDKYLRDYNGGVTSGSCNSSEFSKQPNGVLDYKICSAYIIFNPKGNDPTSKSNNSAMNLRKTITHEIGHCMNLGHTSRTDQSVMRQGWNLNFNNYDRPQEHDRQDLNNYYNKLYYK